ncbi:alpha/beta-hydrolase [Lindgomyces ingoldianus]|uniref:Alpha/beta-hydrolase n=1 Tax=Lindgomyces ingoldianus TaxID=673940 RepID=A0ACB6QDD7_9PLEO|nr:alpha/beta-hydrolase [Lindgomyces ingoldianus]KAF2464941.1 alpha/beta-hydrolase [Lindgomyces ingoldianus]
MIDHVLGRPSVQFRKIQVLAVVSFWSFYLYRGDRHGPPIIRRISALLSKKLTTWQSLVITLLYLYAARNFGKLIGLECPEPLSNLYSRSYFRATWVTTALDAGFWSAMHIRRKGLRDFCSLVFSIYYMICAEQADEKARKIRGTLTVDHLRVSWNKGTTPYLAALTTLMRPRLMVYPPRKIRIPRPKESSYKEPVQGWLYFNGPLSALKKHDKVVLDIPGGGFVAMDPRNHDDKLMGWAGKSGLPVLSLDYKKAPEFPYPYALNECYDVYHTIVATRGRCMGLSGELEPKIVVSGDSAGGNLAVGMVLMILQSGSTETRQWQGERELPPPVGVILIYPALDMNIGNWMTDEQMALIRDRRVRKTNRLILRRKSDDYRHLAPNTPGVSDDESDEDRPTALPNPGSPAPTPTSSKVLLRSPQTMIRLSAAHTGIDSQSGLSPANTNLKRSTTDATVQKPDPSTPGITPIPKNLGTGTQPLTPAPPAHALRTRLAMSSMISYFNDRILTPEMMRAMIILYIGPHNRPDFSTDFLLSPLLAPESLLAKFPRTWMLTGERDPLVDDTAIFAGRLRQAKRAEWIFGKEMGLYWARGDFQEEDWVNVDLIPGISHGFLQFVSVFPEGWKYILRCSKWMTEAFEWAERSEEFRQEAMNGTLDTSTTGGPIRHRTAREGSDYFGSGATLGLAEAVNDLSNGRRRHHKRSETASSAEEDRPLEMTVVRNSGVSRGKGKPLSPTLDATFFPKVAQRPTPNGNGGLNGRGKGKGKRGSKDGRRKSLVSLASEDDLLGRRMKGLAGGLMGVGRVEENGL